MKALILTLGLGLVAALLPLAWSEQSPDLSGKWYLKALIPDNEDNPDATVESTTPVILTPLDGYKKIDAEYTSLMENHCQKIKATLKKMQGPGEYLAKKYNAVMHFKPLPEKDHIVAYCDMFVHGQVIRTAKLLGRDMSRMQESVEALKKAASAHGFNPDNVVIPKQTDTCLAGE